MMSELLEGTADDDFSNSRQIGTVNGATVEVTAETTIEVTVVDDENAEENRSYGLLKILISWRKVMEEIATKRVLNWITTMMQ